MLKIVKSEKAKSYCVVPKNSHKSMGNEVNIKGKRTIVWVFP